MATKKAAKKAPTSALSLNTAGKSYDELRRLAEKQGTKVKEDPIVDKSELEGVPFIITAVAVREGEHGPYVQCTFLTEDGQVGKFSDGSTGVCAQLDPSQNNGEEIKLPIDVPGGLRASRYTYEDEAGKTKPAITYYLSGQKKLKALEGGRAGRRAG